ncbi:DNA-binding protein [Pseudoalteromonas sp. APC 3358]|uniref:DNA-binding protein n=1 Tax=Brumicola blandensis TaxID=3075611 RepID=A0AAW8QYG3_9ALTE|nr:MULTISPECIES: DNA-binding protein [Alteromonadales]MDN3385166.1 DNA-binding protein [Pseudoalteromonas sp. APC 3358]MDT0581539.1 DNA-binding protein [Alteromonas sp. W409]
MAKEVKDLKEQVFEVCEHLEEQGENCTVRKVLDRIEDYSSVSTTHPFVKAWQEMRLAEREKLRQSFQLSPAFLDSLVTEAEKINKAALRLEQEKVENYKSLSQEVSAELTKLAQQLVASMQEAEKLQNDKRALINQVNVLHQTQESNNTALNAKAEKLVSLHKQEVDISVGSGVRATLFECTDSTLTLSYCQK